MKKKISITILVIILLIFIGAGIIYYFITKTQNNDIGTENLYDNNNITTVEEENESKNTLTTTNNSSYQQNDKNEITSQKKKKYTSIALQGCVITEQDYETGAVTYKKKCESCDYIESGGTSTYLSSGIMNSSFLCPKCKKTQKIQIESNISYE